MSGISILDYRKVEMVNTAGLPITTFIADDPEIIWVSATDLINELCLGEVHFDNSAEFIVYDIVGRKSTHICITHMDINNFLYLPHPPSANLDDFRRFFAHEVMSFWNRFQYSASNMTIREAFMKVDNGAADLSDSLGIPLGRIREFVLSCMLYDVFPNISKLTTEEYAFMAYSEIQYLSVLSQYIASGESVPEAIRQVEQELIGAFTSVGSLVRGYSQI